MSLSIRRHEEIFPAHLHNEPVHLIGAGAIGSRVWAALVELGLTDLHVYDYDKVEDHNLANQIYIAADVGHTKVESLWAWTRAKLGYIPQSMTFNEVKVEYNPAEQDVNPYFHHTVILAVDSIEARRDILDYITKYDMPVIDVFDTRMASTHGNVIHVNPMNPLSLERYLNNLPKDEDTELSACGSTLSVGTTASIIANLAVWQLMHARFNEAALDKNIEIYLKPLCVSTGEAA